ncbi:hypothetical protein EJ03DRAFT_64922 [Teratosphaeria nubilosa]|uniref:Uncharacterized protein n=1 Tax=Teratosphaeria nubilosa TaxID=161662 RepID=A0A6G1LCG5_9PEZI|nr:hypothetical protein EJ03DRAFT_64922 [Teratosphaeria nubilosa]
MSVMFESIAEAKTQESCLNPPDWQACLPSKHSTASALTMSRGMPVRARWVHDSRRPHVVHVRYERPLDVAANPLVVTRRCNVPEVQSGEPDSFRCRRSDRHHSQKGACHPFVLRRLLYGGKEQVWRSRKFYAWVDAWRTRPRHLPRQAASDVLHVKARDQCHHHPASQSHALGPPFRVSASTANNV